MRVRFLALLGLSFVLTRGLPRANAQTLQPEFDRMRSACRRASVQTERAANLPPGIMLAIGRVESGRPDPVSDDPEPWPWTVNRNGEGRYFDTEQNAIAWVTAQLRSGTRSIDVGCFQVNLLHHPRAFASLDAAFDPVTNAAFAARLLRRLYAQSGSWASAIALYHSSDPREGRRYSQRVVALWRGTRGTHTAVVGTMLDDPVVVRRALGASAVRIIVPTWATGQVPMGQSSRRSWLPRVFVPGD